MIAHWYHKGEVKMHTFSSLKHLMAFDSPIPINSQVWIEQSHGSWGEPVLQNQWFQVNARNRLVPVPIGVCAELRAAFLLMGICP